MKISHMVCVAVCALACYAGRGAYATTVTVPVDVSAGPAGYVFTGALFEDQPVHFGLAFDLYAVIDQKTLRENKNRIPKKYRDAVTRMNEVRYSPSIFIPDGFFISPKVGHTGMYGVTWRPFSVGLTCLPSPTRIHVSSGLLATAIFIHSDRLPSPTLFLRPGLDIKIDFELQITEALLLSAGWASQLYVPQRLGSLAVLPFDETSIWHIGMAYGQLHIRFPRTQTL